MTFFLVLLTGAGLILVVSAMEDVSIADTVRGFVNGEVAKKAASPNNTTTTTPGNAHA